MNLIDLPKDAPVVCECCKEQASAYRDAEIGAVCADCFGHALQAAKQLRRANVFCGANPRNGGPCQP
jgi:hypothetical protein